MTIMSPYALNTYHVIKTWIGNNYVGNVKNLFNFPQTGIFMYNITIVYFYNHLMQYLYLFPVCLIHSHRDTTCNLAIVCSYNHLMQYLYLFPICLIPSHRDTTCNLASLFQQSSHAIPLFIPNLFDSLTQGYYM